MKCMTCGKPATESEYDDWWHTWMHACEEHAERMREAVKHDNDAQEHTEGYAR